MRKRIALKVHLPLQPDPATLSRAKPDLEACYQITSAPSLLSALDCQFGMPVNRSSQRDSTIRFVSTCCNSRQSDENHTHCSCVNRLIAARACLKLRPGHDSASLFIFTSLVLWVSLLPIAPFTRIVPFMPERANNRLYEY
jgi:hypothetical protein